MGLSVGWGDLYRYGLHDQYFDITGLGPGCYRLEGTAEARRGVLDAGDLRHHRHPSGTSRADHRCQLWRRKTCRIACGLGKAEAGWRYISSAVGPHPEKHEVYEELYSVYRNLYPTTRAMVHTLSGMQTGGQP